MGEGSTQERREGAGVALDGDGGHDAPELSVIGGYALVEEKSVTAGAATGDALVRSVATEDGHGRVIA